MSTSYCEKSSLKEAFEETIHDWWIYILGICYILHLGTLVVKYFYPTLGEITRDNIIESFAILAAIILVVIISTITNFRVNARELENSDKAISTATGGIITLHDLLLRESLEDENKLETFCCGEKMQWNSRDEAIQYFHKKMVTSTGKKHNSYLNVYSKIIIGDKYCSDED